MTKGGYIQFNLVNLEGSNCTELSSSMNLAFQFLAFLVTSSFTFSSASFVSLGGMSQNSGSA